MNKVGLKNVIILSGAICAYLIGSGFATGQEVLQFFTASGRAGIIAPFIFLAIMGTSTLFLCRVGQKEKFENPYDVFEFYCGKFIGQIYIWISVVLNYCIFVVMLAGGGATVNQYFGFPAYMGTGIIAFFALLTTLLGMEKLIKIIGVLGPIKIIFVIILGISAFITLFGHPTLLSEASNNIAVLNIKSASPNWAWSGALYACLCLIMSIAFLVNCGTCAHSLKEATIVGVASIIAYTMAILMLVIAELVNYELIAGKQVPTLAIAEHVSPILGTIFSLLIVLAIYSAASSLLLMTVRKFAVDRTKKFNIMAIVFTAIGMLFGGIVPFDKLVNVLYPLAGYATIAFIVLMVYKEVKIKKLSLRLRNEPANAGLSKQG